MTCVGAAAAVSLAGAGCRPSAGPPSVLLIVVDTLRADHVGALRGTGDPSPTPNLDRWAAGGARFRRAATPAPFTMPAMAAVFAGVYPDRCGILTHVPGTTLAAWDGQTLAESARLGGLATAAVVANPWLVRPGTRFDRGFDAFERLHGNDPGGANTASAVTDAATRMLGRMGDRRFLMWVHYFDPHMPYEPPAGFAAAAGATGGDENPVMRDFCRKGRNLGRIFRGEGYTPDQLDDARRLYEGEVRYVDAEIGRLLARLDELGRSDDTVVVVASDHGEALGEHGLWFAHDYTVYDELLHVALMMRGPGIPEGARDDLVSLLDLAPTLCRVASLPCAAAGDDRFDGRDLFVSPRGARTLFAAATTMRGRASAFGRLQVPGIDGRWTMAEDDRHKLVRIPATAGVSLELYDRIADPGDAADVAAASHDDVVGSMSARLEAWSREMDRSRPLQTPSSLGDGRAEERGDGRKDERSDTRKKEREDERTLRSLGYLQ